MSDFLNKYPYTDFHELNLDWVIERVKKLTEDWLATQEAWNNTQEQWQQLHDYVMDYFANLDVQDEINNKINQMILDGTFMTIVAPTINQTVTDATTTWLAAHITQPTTPAIDNTLTIAGAAADAKAAGDGIRNSYQYGDFYNDASEAGANDDLDNIPTGTVFTYNYNPTNAPVSTFLGSVITFTGRNGQSALRSQLAFDDNDNVMYYRSKVNLTWSAWIEISQQLKHLGLYYNTDDLNNLVGTCMVICAQTPINTPAAGFIGNVFTFSGSANPAQSNNLTQIACDVQTNNIYMRNKFSTWTTWLQINQPVVLRLNGISGDPIDFDTLRSNTIGTYYGTCTNAPITPFIGTVFTYAGSDNQGSNITQIASYFRNGLNRLYIRCKYTSWTAWNELTNKTTSMGLLPATTDLDDMVSGTIALFASAPINSPATPFNGNVFTYSGADHVGATQNLTQIATATNGTDIWIRNKYATWGDWVHLNDSGIKYYNNKAFRPLGDFCACGDSLTVSLSVYDDNTYVTVKSWAQYIADDCAGTATIYAQGGITTAGYLASALFTSACAHTGDAAFIFLGTNDGNQGVSEATYKQNYQDIVDGLLVNHKFVVCISLTKGISYPNYNNAIQEICTNTANAFYCDITPYADDFLKYKNHGHLSSFGYSALASAIELGLNNMIGDNDSYFQFTYDFS